MSKPVDTIEDLFRWGSRAPTADTSREAYEKQKPKTTAAHQQILALVDDMGDYGVTLDEACIRLRMLVQTGSGRFRELVKNEELVDSGRRRNTRTGSPARVYIRKAKP